MYASHWNQILNVAFKLCNNMATAQEMLEWDPYETQ